MTTNRDEALENLADQFGAREAGVADLVEFYEHMEAIYAAASQSSPETPYATTSNSTNRE